MNFAMTEDQQIATDSFRRFLEAEIRPIADEYRDEFIAKHKCTAASSPYAGLECLAALARESSPDVQGRVAFRLRELVRNASSLTPL